MPNKFFFLVFLFFNPLFANSTQLNITTQQPVPTEIDAITFTFSNAVISSNNAGKITHEKLLLCTPEITGAFEYISDREIKLYPTDPLHTSIRYNCKANPKFFPNVSGKSVSFQTEPFRLKEMRYFKEGILRLEFNDALPQKALQNNLFIYKKIKLAKTKLRYQLTANKTNTVFLAKILEPTGGAPVEVVLKKSLKSTQNKPLDQTYQNRFEDEAPPFKLDAKRKSMPIFDKPRFIALNNGRLGIRVYFPGYFYRDETPLKPYISIKGIDSFSVTDVRYIDYEERQKLHLDDRSETYADIIADFQPNHTYTLTLKKGLKDSYQYQLREDKSFTVKMGDRKSALHFEQNKPYLSSKGEIGFESVNLDKVTMIIEKIPDFNYRYFVNFQKGDTEKVQKSAIQVYSKELTLTNTKNKFVKHRFSLQKFTDTYKSGIFRIVMRFGKRYAQKIVFLSDIGISAKISKDQAFVSLAKLSDATAIPNAKVAIFSDKNALIATGESDAEGICIIDQKDLALQNPTAVVVTTANDQNFLVLNTPLNKAQILQKENIANRYKAWIYLQSDLIRPGSEAKMLIVLKDKDYRSAENLPVEVSVESPDFQTVYKEALTCDDTGTIELILDIPETYKTGTYKVTVKLGHNILGTKYFFVESFLPQKIKNEIVLDKTEFFKNEAVEGVVRSAYLFGAPAAGLGVEASLLAVSKPYTNENYKGYSFTDITLDKENKTNYIDIIKSLQLSDKGEARFYFPLAFNQHVPSILEGKIRMSVFDDGKEVAAYKTITIYPYDQMVGVAVETPQLERGEELRAKTVLLDLHTGQPQKRVLEVVIKKVLWHYFFNDRGFYQWEKELEEIDRFDINAGDIIRKKMDASGEYILEVRDLLGEHSASQSFSVRGWDYDNIRPTNEIGTVQLQTDDFPLKRGDTLHIQLQSPILKGRLLVTLESDKVHYHKVHTIDKGTASLDIPVDFALQEGFYLHTSVVRESGTPATLVPFRAWGEKFIKADRSEHQINLSIETPKLAHSHEKITVSVSCDKKAYLLISAVDEGILQIIDQKPPQPFDFFNIIPKERVGYYDLYDQLMHYQTKGKLLEFGAGDLMPLMAPKHLPPENAAKRVKPFMYWSGLIQTDEEGFADVEIEIPQFNGKAKIVAIALDKEGIGATSTDVIVRDDIILKPSYPHFALTGDKIKIPLRIFNTTDQATEVTLSVQTSGQVALSDLPENIQLPPKSSRVFETTLLANGIAKGEINITATSKQKQFLHTLELPVYSPNALQTKVYRGESSKKVILKIPNDYFSQQGTKVKISLSKNYLAQLRTTLDDLVNYPYGCSEQTASRLLALLYFDTLTSHEESAYVKEMRKDRKRFIREGISKLAAMQLENGDFAYWDSYREVNPYASVYASDILLSLQKADFKVPQPTLDGIFDALREIVQRGRSYEHTAYGKFERLYAAYLLSRENQLSDTMINTLYDNHFYDENNIVSLYMMAIILKNAGLTTPQKAIEQKINRFDYGKLSDRQLLGGNFYSKTRDLSFALYLHLQLFGKDKQAYTLLEKIASRFDKLDTTQEKAFALRAVSEYYQGSMAENKIDAILTYNNQSREITKATTLLDSLKNTTITIDPKGKLINYAVEVSGYLPLPVNANENKQQKHFSIQSTFVNRANKPVNLNQLHVGDLLYQKITLTNKENLENIVVVERIPACFEIANERLSKEKRASGVQDSKNFKPSYQDIRDDRVLTFLNLAEPERIYHKKNKHYTIKPNVTTFYTPLRVTAKGECQMPATFSEAMYDSRIYDYSKIVDAIEVR